MNIIIQPKKILVLLLIIVVSLQIANIIGLVLYFNDIKIFFNLFNIRTEGNIPAYYSSITILFASFLLGFISLFRKIYGLSYSLWLVLSIIFFYFSYFFLILFFSCK
jgi:hypothetical protein